VYLFRQPEFERSLASLAKALKPGGRFLAFDWFHPYEQELAIFEKSATHPEGLLIHARPYSLVEKALAKAGFGDVAFRPFAIPIDLEQPRKPTDMRSYTVPADGRRLLFRGALFQPWCHLVARKVA
jgi:SAM-dependent methyltransferase